MPKLRYSAKDLLKGTMIDDPKWYGVVVDGIREEPAASDGSQNIIVDMTIESEGEFQGVPLMRYFNEKAPGFVKEYAEACQIELSKEGGVFDFDLTVGKHIEAYVEQTKDKKGNFQNSVSKFRPRIVPMG
jgi:hypothetical protein